MTIKNPVEIFGGNLFIQWSWSDFLLGITWSTSDNGIAYIAIHPLPFLSIHWESDEYF